ncbi:TPA: hypothetical protein HA249_02680 [Candidatus Woesearchaeota archaeon]|nr:hypothetical protein [Candidatus Woesearchaeota archaeon]
MNLDYTTGFEPRTEVVELWKALALPVSERVKKCDKLREIPEIELFENVRAASVLEWRLLRQLVQNFFGGSEQARHSRGSAMEEFLSASIENVFQHADPEEYFRRDVRGVYTPAPYARAAVAADIQKERWMDLYVMDNGMGFVHPNTGEDVMREAVQLGRGFGKHSVYGQGVNLSLVQPNESVLISVDSLIRKPGPYTGFSPVEPAPPAHQGIKGTLVCGRFYHPRVQDEMRRTC